MLSNLFNFVEVPSQSRYEKDNSFFGKESYCDAIAWLFERDYEIVGISKHWKGDNRHPFDDDYKLLILRNKDTNEYYVMHMSAFTYSAILRKWFGISGPELKIKLIKFCEE